MGEEAKKAREKSIRLETKLREVLKRGGGCSLCGYNGNLASLEFHHINPKEKEMEIGKIWRGRDLSELKKTVLVCRSCHRKIHSGNSVEKFIGHRKKEEALLFIYKEINERCQRCNTKVEIGGFDFHHPEGVKKTGNPSVIVYKYFEDEEIRKELDSCQKVCPNCHFDIHYPDLKMGIVRLTIEKLKRIVSSNTQPRSTASYLSPRRLFILLESFDGSRKDLAKILGVPYFSLCGVISKKDPNFKRRKKLERKLKRKRELKNKDRDAFIFTKLQEEWNIYEIARELNMPPTTLSTYLKEKGWKKAKKFYMCKETLERKLKEYGNISLLARSEGVNRNTVYKWMEKHDISAPLGEP